MKIQLEVTTRKDERLLKLMNVHYSQPKGFVGRNICYAILYDGEYYGHIVGGSATKFLPGRNDYFNCSLADLNKIVNNIFFHAEKVNNTYPLRNFTSQVLKTFREKIFYDWKEKYGDVVIGYESLVELPRTGDCYIKDNWEIVGQTIGYTCKRIAGKGTDSWHGKRIWDRKHKKPKLVFCRRVE